MTYMEYGDSRRAQSYKKDKQKFREFLISIVSRDKGLSHGNYS